MTFDFAQAAAACSTCPKLCRHACPTAIASGRESRTPTAKSTYGSLWGRGLLALDDDVRQAFYDCCHCGLCAEHCEVDGVDLVAETRYLRGKLADQGVALPAVAEWAAAYERTGWPAGTPIDVFTRYSRTVETPRTLVLIGAAARSGEPLIQAALALADARGEAVATLGGAETSSGGAALDLGYPALAQRLGAALAEQLNAGPWERILVLDSTEAVLLSQDWPAMGIRLNKPVVTWPAWLHEGLVELAETGERVAYHDPCGLARAIDETATARALIRAAGAELVEPVWSGRQARSCGGGGGLPVSNPVLADTIAADLADQFRGLDVARVLTACGECAARLGAALGPDLPVEDLGQWWLRRSWAGSSAARPKAT